MRKLQSRSPDCISAVNMSARISRLGLLAVLDAERLDARLAELTRVRGVGAGRLIAERRAIVAVVGGAGGVTLQVEPARGHRQIGAQAQLRAVEVGEDVGAPSQSLAKHVEETAGRLDDGRRHGLASRRAQHGEQGASLALEGPESAGGGAPMVGHLRLRPDLLEQGGLVGKTVGAQQHQNWTLECQSQHV